MNWELFTKQLSAAARKCDAGITLVEVLVTMVISSVLLVAVSAMAIGGVRTAEGTDQRNEAIAALRTATDRLTKEIRTADHVDRSTPSAILVAERERFGFYAQLDTLDLSAANAGAQTQRPSIVWLWTRDSADGRRELCQQIYKSTVSASGGFNWPVNATNPSPGARTCHVVARGLSRSEPRPTFTYLRASDESYRSDGSSVSTVILDAGAAGPVADLSHVESVELWLAADINARSNVRDPSTVARVTLSNLIS